jgi:putative ABC transport system permease protein
MSKWKIAWRSIQQRALASSLTGISMALGVMLVVAVLVVHGVIDKSFLNNSGLGYNVVVGAKGGRLELVLNSVYYLAKPVENIPYSYYQEFIDGKFKAYVDKAIPICMGDMFQDYRVIGTTPAFFNDLDYGGHKYEFEKGENFAADDYFGAVIGSTVARETGLKVGDEFHPSHGAGPDAHQHDPFAIRGVLKPTGTPNDRGLFINMEGFYLIPEHAKATDDMPAEALHDDDHKHDEDHKHSDADEKHADHHDEVDGVEHEHKHDAAETADDDKEHAGHAADHEHAGHEHAEEHGHEEAHAHEEGHHHHEHGEHSHEPLPLEKREVTAILVLTAGVPSAAGIPGVPPGLLYGAELMKSVNKDSVAQVVMPIREMSSLFETFVDPLRLLLLGLTVMIVIVSGIGILVSIYNSMSERRHEIAVIRALGAGRRTVMFIVLLESILLSLAGGVVGWLVGHALIAVLSPWIAVRTGVSIGFLEFVGYELVIIPGLIVLASLVGYLPAMAAYRTDVAKALSATP